MATLNLTDASRIYGSLAGSTDLTVPVDTINIVRTEVYTNGTGTNQGNDVWTDTRSIAAAGESLNLRDGTLFNSFGEALTLSQVKGIIIRNKTEDPGRVLTLTGDFITAGVGTGTDEFVHPGGEWKRTSPVDGFTVSAAQDVITFATPGGTDPIIYDIIIWGVT